MKNISMILCLILLNCFKSINVTNYNKKGHNSNEENKKEEQDLKKVGDNKSEEDIKGQNLINAVRCNDKNKVIEALKNGADVNYKDPEGKTPLIHALSCFLFYVNKSILKILIDAGANVNYEDPKGKIPLMYSLINFDSKPLNQGSIGNSVLKILINAGADISRINIFKHNFILRHSKLIKLLIEKGYMDVNKVFDNKRTFINKICCEVYGPGILFACLGWNLFIDRGINFNTQDVYGNTPIINLLLGETHSSEVKLIKKFIKYGADINIQNNEGNTALHIAAKGTCLSPFSRSFQRHNLHLFEFLLDSNANALIKNNLEEDALIIIIESTIKFFKSYTRTDIHECYLGYYPTKYRTKSRMIRFTSAIKKVMKFGFDINTKFSNGDTPLILATKISSSTLVRTLLKLNANIFEKNNSGEDALIASVKRMNGLIKKYNLTDKRFIYMFPESIKIFKKLLELYPSESVDVDLLIRESTNIIEDRMSKEEGIKPIEKILSMIFDNPKFIKLLLYKDGEINIARILCIQNLNINEEFKNNIMKKINIVTLFSKDSFAFENSESLIKALFSYDTFIFKNKCLLVDAFLNVVKLNNLEDDNDVKEINRLLVDSLTTYYIDKTNNKIGYEDRFLKEIGIIKDKINVFVFRLYNRNSVDSEDSSTN